MVGRKNSKVKVVQLSSVHPSNDTRIFYKICKSLVGAGFDVDLIIQHDKDEAKEGVNIIALPRAKRKLDRLLKIIPAITAKALQYNRNTIFHFHDPELIPIGLILKFLGYKVIYDVHEDVPKDFLTKEWIKKPLRKLLSKIVLIVEWFSSRFFDGIITVVESITIRFLKYNKNVFEVRNYPVIELKDSSNYQKKSNEVEYIIYVGSLTTRRGIPKLVDAISLIKNKKIELWLGGEIAEKGLLETMKEKEGWHRTKLLGWVDFNSINPILSNALCGMMTLELVPSHNESLSVKMFEYMLAEIPIISTNLKFPSEVIKEINCGLIIEDHTPESIAFAIDKLKNNPEKAKEMGKRGRKAVLTRYNWDNEKEKLLDLYKTICP